MQSGYWVTYYKDVISGPFEDYDTAAKEADRAASRFFHVNYHVRFGTREQVSQ